MALTKTIPLTTPVKIGGNEYTELVLTEPTSEHILEAQEESEKVVMAGKTPALVASPSLVGLNILRRQVVSIGKPKAPVDKDAPHEIGGPVDVSIIKRLSPTDLQRVQDAADELDAMASVKAMDTLAELEKRGRAGEQDG